MRFKKLSSTIIGVALLSAGLLAGPTAANASTGEPAAPTVASSEVITPYGPVGPCSQQSSGVRTYFEWGHFNLQNCNTTNIRAQLEYTVALGPVGSVAQWTNCTTVSPGAHIYTPLPSGTGKWRYC